MLTMFFRFGVKKMRGMLCFLVLLSAAAGLSDAHAADGKILISVVDDVTLRPIQESDIRIISRDQSEYRMQTDAKGKAESVGLAPGLYELVVNHQSYFAERRPSVRVVSEKTSLVKVQLVYSKDSIEQVFVMGSQSSGAKLNPVSSSQLDRESLRSAAGSGSDVLRALDGLPGLFSDGEFSSYTVRGNGPRDNLILVDGIPFDRVVHFSEGFGELEDLEGGGRYSVFAPNIIDQAEFQPGGWNAAYGGRAGSLLKLNVAEGNPESPAYTMRVDIAGLEIGYDGPSHLHDSTTLLFSARQLNFGRLFDLVGLEDIGEPELTDIIVKTRTDIGDDDTLKFLLIHAPESYERNIDHALASDEDSPGIYEDLELVESDADNTLFATTWTKLLGTSGELNNRFYYRHYGESSRSGEVYPDQVSEGTPVEQIPVRFPIVTADRDETEIGWRLDYSFDNGLGRFDSGLRVTHVDLDFSRQMDDDWIRYEYDQSDFRPDPNQRYIVLTPESVNAEYTQSAMQYVAYFDQQFDFGEWDIRAGLRYENDRLIRDDDMAPRLAVSWRASEKTRLVLTAGRYLQTPRFMDQASDESNNLSFEKNDQVSLGVKYRFSPDLELFFEPYYQKLSERIVLLDGVDQTYANEGEGKSYGIDTAITRFFGGGWSASATYSYNQSKLKDSEQGMEYDADYSRPHAFSLGGVWEINDRWKISGRWKWASGRPFNDFVVYENVLGDGQAFRYSKEAVSNNTERYGSFDSLNLRIDYRRAFGKTQLIAFLDVINLYGSDNPSESEFNERTGENVIEDGESLPLIGLRFEW